MSSSPNGIRVYGNRLRPVFTPRPRFRVLDGVQRESFASSTLRTPRPLDLLTDLTVVRRIGQDDDRRNALTARDHLVLELLLTAAYEQARRSDFDTDRVRANLGLEDGQFYLPVAFALRVLRLNGRNHLVERELLDSLARLKDSVWSLPALIAPNVRMSQRRADYIDRIPLETDPDDFITALPPETMPIAVEPFVDRGDPDLDASNAFLRSIGMTNLGKLGHLLSKMKLPTSVEGDPAEGQVLFRPILRHLVRNGMLVFELSSDLAFRIEPRRLDRFRRVRFSYVDLREISAFDSPYSAPLYRRLIAQSYDRERNRLRYDETWSFTVEADELAKMVGYRRQAGGLRGQLVRNVIDRIKADFRKAGADCIQIVIREKASRSDKAIVLDVHLPLPADISRIGRTTSWKEGWRTLADEVDRDDARSAAKTKEGRLAIKVRQLEFRAEYRHQFPHQAGPYNLSSASVARRVANHVGGSMAEAWLIAIDEIHNAGHPYYGDLTGRGCDRRYRGDRLRRLVYDVGADRAYMLFALEESRDPDLTKARTAWRLRLEGTVDAAREDIPYRVAATKGMPPRKAERVRKSVAEVDLPSGAPVLATARPKNMVAVELRKAASERRAAMLSKRPRRDGKSEGPTLPVVDGYGIGDEALYLLAEHLGIDAVLAMSDDDRTARVVEYRRQLDAGETIDLATRDDDVDDLLAMYVAELNS